MEPRIATMELMNEMHVVSSLVFFFSFSMHFSFKKLHAKKRNEMLLNFSFLC